MKNQIKYSLVLPLLLLGTSLSAIEFGMTTGVQDFVVTNIVNDVALDGIHTDTSHTLGLNLGVFLKHTTRSNINFFAKFETFLDYDKDHLDPDHIPVWFDSLIDIDGSIYSINSKNLLKWYVVFDNKQNTVSCIEREIRQHIGLGYQYNNDRFIFATNAYLGFYYIEIDDDTPVNRGYTRQDTDDGEASNAFEVEMKYRFNNEWSFYTKAKRYMANAGAQTLEDNIEGLITYNTDFLAKGSSMNLKVKYVKYDLDRFYKDPPGVAILPFDNESLIQAYVTMPLDF